MHAVPLALVLAGSLLHIGWNALAKDAENKLAFLWLALLPAAVLGLFWLPWALSRSGGLPPAGLACLGASALLHAAYFRLLTAAYGEGDLSFVYPQARGLGAVGATAGGILLLGEAPSALGWCGIVLAAGATFVEAAARGRRGAASRRALLLTLATAGFIGAYLVVDKVGVARLEPGLYLSGMIAATAILLAPAALAGGRARRELARARNRIAAAAIFLSAGYGVVLAAMARAPVSYVVAARASGIVAGAFAGLLLFGERVDAPRWLAVALTAAGVALVALA